MGYDEVYNALREAKNKGTEGLSAKQLSLLTGRSYKSVCRSLNILELHQRIKSIDTMRVLKKRGNQKIHEKMWSLFP
jgi:hypothetical protein